MFDDVFTAINDWFGENQHLNMAESTLDSFDLSNDLLDSESISSVMEDNEQQSLLDSLDYSNSLISDVTSDLVMDFEENSALDFDNSTLVTDSQMLNIFFAPSDYYFYEETWDISEFDGIGSPFVDADCWQKQEGANSCAVVAQMGIYESITGVELSEDFVCEFAEANGLFDPNAGTFPSDLGKILNHFGVTTESQYDATLNDIAEALERGDKVIVGLDAQEIWQPIRDSDGNPIEQSDAGHAVWVTGIDQLPDGSVKIILNDSGTYEGQMKVVDAVDFMNAWNDFANQLVVAHNSPPSVIV